MPILDDLRECSQSDCPNPNLINLYFDDDICVSKYNEKVVRYYIDECEQCRMYLQGKVKIQIESK